MYCIQSDVRKWNVNISYSKPAQCKRQKEPNEKEHKLAYQLSIEVASHYVTIGNQTTQNWKNVCKKKYTKNLNSDDSQKFNPSDGKEGVLF